MKKRDLAILNDLNRFRCLTRDDIIDLHFSRLKQPITSCNTVLKRLRREGYIDVNTNFHPYLYFPSPTPIKKDSTKIPHFLKIAAFYKLITRLEIPKRFIVEPKYQKGYMEPDIFMIAFRTPFFIEIQRNIYSSKVINEKISRYEEYYFSRKWQEEDWQPNHKKVFPILVFFTETQYDIKTRNYPIWQFANFDDFIAKINKLNFEKEKRKTQRKKVNSLSNLTIMD